MNEGDGWLTSYVMSRSGDVCFFIVIEKGISAILYNNEINLGDFYEVKIVYNDKAIESHKARHLVTRYRKIEPLAPVRIENLERITRVIVTTTARFERFVKTQKGTSCATFYNDTFGTFVDLDNVVRETDKLVEFEFKCKSSPLDKTRSVFIPTKVLRYLDEPPRCDVHIGLVGVESKMTRARFVWTKNLENDVLIDEHFFPPDRYVTGLWIEFTVNSKLQVVDPVRIIQDVQKTRVISGIPEIWATFQHDGMCDNRFLMFYHDDYGFICDTEGMVPRVEPKGWYQGWILRHRIDGLNSRWKISVKQRELELWRRDADSRPVSRAQSNLDNREFENGHTNVASSRWSNHGSESSNHRNDNQHRAISRISNSENNELPPSRNNSRSGNLHDLSYGKTQDFNDEQDDRRSQRSNRHSNVTSLNMPDDAERFHSSYARNSPSSSVSDRGQMDCSKRSIEAHGYTNDDVAPARRRELCESPDVMGNLNNPDFVSDDEEDRPRPSHEFSEVNKRRNIDSAPPSNAIASGGTRLNQGNSSSHTSVSEMDEDIRLKFDRMCEILDYFLTQPTVCQPMRRLDVEQYEELLEICKFENESSG